MIDEKTVWDDIWPVVEGLISATVAEDPQTIRQLLQPGGQAADALDLYGAFVFDILLKTVMGREQLGLTRAIEGDGGELAFIEYAWPDPASINRSYSAVDVVAVQLTRTAGGWRVVEVNPASADLPINSMRATSILAGTQVMSEEGKVPSEPWILPIALYAGALQLPLLPEALADAVEAALLPGMQERRFGILPQIYARRLWRDFRAAQPDAAVDDRPRAWAAAAEVIMSEQTNREATQAAVSRHYRAPLGAVSARTKQIRRSLGIQGFDERYTDLSTTQIIYKESDE